MGHPPDDAAGDRVAQGKAGHLPGLADGRLLRAVDRTGALPADRREPAGAAALGPAAAAPAAIGTPPSIPTSSRATSSIRGRTDDFSVLVHLAEHVGGLPVVAGNSISLMSDTDVVIDRLIADIDAARHHVHLLFYIFQDDSVGRRVAEALARAAAAAWCAACWPTAVGSRQLFRRLAPWLRQQGVRILPVLPATLWRLPFARLDLRNHRKLAVIDGRMAFTGSQNIVEASYGHKRAGVWHDVMARITGPVVRQLQGIFLEDWFYESGELLEDAALFPPDARPTARSPSRWFRPAPTSRPNCFRT